MNDFFETRETKTNIPIVASRSVELIFEFDSNARSVNKPFVRLLFYFIDQKIERKFELSSHYIICV
jgi:hypothetical protein